MAYTPFFKETENWRNYPDEGEEGDGPIASVDEEADFPFDANYILNSIIYYLTHLRFEQGETSGISNDLRHWILHTNGWGSSTLQPFLHDHLAGLLRKVVDGDIYEDSSNTDEARSNDEIIDIIQSYVKDPKAKQIVAGRYPSIFNRNEDEDEDEEEEDLDALNMVINRAVESSYNDKIASAVISEAKDRLGEAFTVTVMSWDSIVLTYYIQPILDYIGEDAANDQETIDYEMNNFSIYDFIRENDQYIAGYDNRFLDNVYGDYSGDYGGGRNYLEGEILDYGVDY